MDPASEHRDPVDAILEHHGFRGPWQELPATGISSRIYATNDMVLKIAVDSSGALDDARTESVAAPVALAAGVRVPRLIAFDDSGSVTNRAYSLWERIQGETLGLFVPDPHTSPVTWRDVGHRRTHCLDGCDFKHRFRARSEARTLRQSFASRSG